MTTTTTIFYSIEINLVLFIFEIYSGMISLVLPIVGIGQLVQAA